MKNKLIEVSCIKISDEFKTKYPKAGKLWHKYDYYMKNKEFESKIVVDKRLQLKDGYTTYLLAKMFGIDKINVTII